MAVHVYSVTAALLTHFKCVIFLKILTLQKFHVNYFVLAYSE